MNSAPTAPAAEAESSGAFVRKHVLPGTAGSVLLAMGSLGVGWLPINSSLPDRWVVNFLRTSTAGSITARLAVLLGLALLLQSWLVLGADVMHGRSPSLSRLRTLLFAWSAPVLLVPPLFSRDVYSYYVQGKLIAHGLNPYVHGVVDLPGWFNDGADPTWGSSPTPYGPLFLLIERGIATAVGEHPYTAALLFRLVSVVGVLLLLRFVPRLAFLGGIDPRKAVWLAVLNPVVIMHFVIDSHNDSLMIGLVVAGLTLAAEGRYWSGLVLVAGGAAVKPIGLLAVPFAGLFYAGTTSTWRSRIRAWAIGLLVTAAVFVVLSALVAVGPGWVPALVTPGALLTWLSPSTAVALSLSAVVRALGLGHHQAGLLTVFHALGLVIAAALVLRLLLRPEHRNPARGAGLAFLSIVALAPTVQPWYLIWCLPLLAASGLTRRQVQLAVLLTTALGLHGLVTSAAASNSVVRFSPGTGVFAALCVLGGVLLISRRERSLVLGTPLDSGIHPEDQPSRSRALRLAG